MNLAVDIGNTRTKIGIFDGLVQKETLVFNHNQEIDFYSIITTYNIRCAILSSTVEIPASYFNIAELLEQSFVLNKHTLLPFPNLYSSKDTLGNDRLALVAAAQAQFPHQHNLVIGCGTCITFNFINANDEFLGGSIHPGLKMRFNAMHHFTGKLPLAEITTDVSLVADTTISNLQTGVVIGAAKEIDGMIDEYLVKFPELNVIITGGDAGVLVNQLKNKIFAISDFTLIGLNYILLYNAK